jgi:hypothetical protein
LVQKFPQVHFSHPPWADGPELCSKLLSVLLMKDSVYRGVPERLRGLQREFDYCASRCCQGRERENSCLAQKASAGRFTLQALQFGFLAT